MSGSIASPLIRLAAEQRRLFRDVSPEEPSPATMRTVRQLLRPDFEVVVSRGTTIEDTEAQLLRLTEEQFGALDLLADNEQCSLRAQPAQARRSWHLSTRDARAWLGIARCLSASIVC